MRQSFKCAIASIAIAAMALCSSASADVFMGSNTETLDVGLNATGDAPGTQGDATLYPSTITASGLTGTVVDVVVDFGELTHTYPDDLDILLESPDGVVVGLMLDVGGADDIVSAVYSFASGSPAMDGGAINASGTYEASGTAFGTSGGSGPTSTGETMADFNVGSGNGDWNLYYHDDFGGDFGQLDGWSITITTAVPEPGTLGLLSLAFCGLAARRRR